MTGVKHSESGCMLASFSEKLKVTRALCELYSSTYISKKVPYTWDMTCNFVLRTLFSRSIHVHSYMLQLPDMNGHIHDINSLAEARRVSSSLFHALDLDDTGELTHSNMMVLCQDNAELASYLIQVLDVNKSGAISENEFITEFEK